MFKRISVWAVFYTLLLLSFTVYAALDTFVIARVYTAVPQQNSTEAPNTADTKESQNQTDTGKLSGGTSGQSGIPDTSANSYTDENISIVITQYREYDTSIYVADVILSSPAYLKTALAQNAYGRNITEKTSQIAQSSNALLAVNGDYYGSREGGYVIRNQVLYRNTPLENQEDLVIYEDGSFQIIAEEDISAEQLLEDGAVQTLSFGPALVIHKATAVTTEEEVGKARASNPRTALGIFDDLHYVFVVSDGRTSESEGLSLYQLAEFMKTLGVSTAYNLDGGGSSTLYFNGEVINNPTTSGRSIKERSVSDIVYIGYGE